MKPEVEKGDIVNLAPYHFYMKVTGDEAEDAFSGQTVPLDVEKSEEIARSVAVNSQELYATPKATIEKRMTELFADGTERKPGVTKKQGTEPEVRTKIHDV